jgi:lipopolysaccharide export system permease protein
MRPLHIMPGAVTARYLIREFLGFFFPIVLAFITLYLIVDFFDRLEGLLKNHAGFSAILRYFVFKIPLIVTQILPPAGLAAMLISLGTLSRRNEITALRASGVSLIQTASPLLALATALSIATLVWDETVVPYCMREYQYVKDIEIRKREQRSMLSDHDIWYHGTDGFYNIEHIDPRRQTLYGVTLYQTDSNFALRSILQASAVHWDRSRWVSSGTVEHTIGGDGNITTKVLPSEHLLLHETLQDFLEVHREPEELNYLSLRQRIKDLSRKGIDASAYLVGLNLKLAVPFTTLVLACVAVPLAGRVQRHPSIAAIVGTGLATGFGYWVILALSNSLGQSGVLPPVVSAWTANGIFLLLASVLFLSSE